MPELPEVETVRRGLLPVFEGFLIEKVEQRRPDLRYVFPPHFTARLEGQFILHLQRRAKYLITSLSGGECLIMHLGMSGSFRIERSEIKAGSPPFYYSRSRLPQHDHMVFYLSSGCRVVYNDPRRFGFMDLVPSSQLETCSYFKNLGIEPFSDDFTAQDLFSGLSGHRSDLKAALLDQSLIAGLGNIYVCEALFRAGLSPFRAASELDFPQASRLGEDILSVLQEALDAGGSSLRDHAQTDGNMGYFQHSLRVYGRDGQPCFTPSCSSFVQKRPHHGRSTFFCASCQF